MFKFQTTTLLNGATADRLDFSKYEETDGILASRNEDPAINWTSEDFDNAKIVLKEGEWLHIERLGKFAKCNVTKIYRRDCVPGTPGSVEIKCALDSTIPSYMKQTIPGAQEDEALMSAGIYRLNLYIRLGQGSQNSNFSNVWVFKGKPLAFEVEITKKEAQGENPANVLAQKLADAIKFETKRFGSKNLKVEVNEDTLVLTAVGPDACYQWFAKAELQKYNILINSALVGGEYENVDDAEVTYTMCQYPFGTSFEIMKDLRLPTPEHTGWSTIVKDEMPVAGEHYAQFMIYMCVDRGIMGGDAVGEITKSVTAHSIWVPQDAADAFQDLLEAALDLEVEGHDSDYKKAAEKAGDLYTKNEGVLDPESVAVDDKDKFNVTAGEAQAHKNAEKKINVADPANEPAHKITKE